MEATMQLTARPVQLAVMTAPTTSLGEALAAARRQRESMVTLIGRLFATAPRRPIQAAG